MKDIYKEIFFKYGTVKRARNCFLYTKKGERLVDLYQSDSKAILGWGNSKAFTQFKNTINKGLTCLFYNEYEKRIEKAVSDLFCSKRKVYIYKSKQKAIKNALKISSNDTFFYRPWNKSIEDISKKSVIIFVPPFPYEQDIYIVCCLYNIVENIQNLNIDESERLIAPLNVAISRAIYDLIEQLPLRQEKNWFIYDKIITKYWNREGPYLFPKVKQEDYDDFVLHCLDCKIVISPDYNVPSVIPFGADLGVFSLLKNNPFKI